MHSPRAFLISILNYNFHTLRFVYIRYRYFTEQIVPQITRGCATYTCGKTDNMKKFDFFSPIDLHRHICIRDKSSLTRTSRENFKSCINVSQIRNTVSSFPRFSRFLNAPVDNVVCKVTSNDAGLLRCLPSFAV